MKAKEFKDHLSKLSLEEFKKEESVSEGRAFPGFSFKNATSPIENPMKLKFLKAATSQGLRRRSERKSLPRSSSDPLRKEVV